MSEELNKNISLIKEKYYDLQIGKVSVSEFKEILLPLLYKISERNFKKIIGEINIRSINFLLINIKDKINAYEYQKDLGNEQEARKEQKDILEVATRIVDKLEDVIDKMEKRDGNSKLQASKDNLMRTLKKPTVEEPEVRIDQSSIIKHQQIGHDVLLKSNDSKSVLNYYFLLRRNVDVSYTLISHIINVINSYIDSNKSKKNSRKSQDGPIFRIIIEQLYKYHKAICSPWLESYRYKVVPPISPIYGETIKKVMKDNDISATTISDIFEDLQKQIFDKYQKIDNVEDLDKFKEYCKNIIKPDLKTLHRLSDIVLNEEGIHLSDIVLQ